MNPQEERLQAMLLKQENLDKGASQAVSLAQYAGDLAFRLRIHRKVIDPGKRAWRRADRRLALFCLVSKSGSGGISLKSAARLLGLRRRDVHLVMCDLVQDAMIGVETGPQSEGKEENLYPLVWMPEPPKSA